MADNSGYGTPTVGEMLASSEVAARASAAAAAMPVEYKPAEIPATASEAAARLEALKSDPKWRDELLGGSKTHAREMRELQAAVDKEQNARTERAMAGIVPKAGPFEDGKARQMVEHANYLRANHVPDAAIRQSLAGSDVTQAEHDAATRAKAALMDDQDFVKAFLGGHGPAKTQMSLINIVLSSPIKRVA